MNGCARASVADFFAPVPRDIAAARAFGSFSALEDLPIGVLQIKDDDDDDDDQLAAHEPMEVDFVQHGDDHDDGSDLEIK